MRGFLTFLVILAIVFFAVGETAGWYLGIPSQTPVFVYKRTATGRASRQAFNVDAVPIRLTGAVRHGSVEVKITFQQPSSVQSNTQAGPLNTLLDRTYQTGQHIAVNQSFKAGKGVYTVVLSFKDATGLFRLYMPNENQL